MFALLVALVTGSLGICIVEGTQSAEAPLPMN